MKKSSIKYSDIINENLFVENYYSIKKTTKHKAKLITFDMFYMENMMDILDSLENRSYKHGIYNIFLVHEPKDRIVMSEKLKDKIIDHMVSNKFLKPALFPKLIPENVATRENKGSKAGINYVYKYFLKMNYKYDNFYILKFDIKKYFYSIDHTILKGMLRKCFKDEEILNLLNEFIDSTNYSYINNRIKKIKEDEIDRSNDSKRIASLKAIPYYKKGIGLSIGSLCNQVFASFYLNGLDHYIKQNLHCKEYVRYQDDGVLFFEKYEDAKNAKMLIKYYLKKKLNLELNEKTRIYNKNEGVNFIGYRFFVNKNNKVIIKWLDNTKNNMRRKIKKYSKTNPDKCIRVKSSYKGMLQYLTSKSLYKKYFDD